MSDNRKSLKPEDVIWMKNILLLMHDRKLFRFAEIEDAVRIASNKEITWHRCQTLIRLLKKCGYIKAKGHKYEITSEGMTFARSPLPPPFDKLVKKEK